MDMQGRATTDTGSHTGEGAHSWRISLNVTRRIVRRMMELTVAEQNATTPVRPQATQVPDAQDFRTSVRLLRRAIRRTILQSATLTPATL